MWPAKIINEPGQEPLLASATEPSAQRHSTADSASPLTLEQAIDMMEQLVDACIHIEFQEKLFTDVGRVFKDKVQMKRVQEQVVWTVKSPIIERFGFERTEEGLEHCLRALHPYRDAPDVAARNWHMQFLITPSLQDVLWKGEVKRKMDLQTGLPDNTTLGPLLTLKQALEMNELIIAGFSTPQFQREVLEGLKQEGADQAEVIRVYQKVGLTVQAPILKKFGFEPSRRGVHVSKSCFKAFAFYPDMMKSLKRMGHLFEQLQYPSFVGRTVTDGMQRQGLEGQIPGDAKEKCAAPKVETSTGRASNSDSATPFAVEQAIELLEQLIAAYIDIEFQEKLFTALGKVFGDKIQTSQVQAEVLWSVQGPIIERFGFERTARGLDNCTRAFIPYNDIPAVLARNWHMHFLTTPSKQDCTWKGEVKRKLDSHTGLPDNTTLPPLLTLKQAMELQDLLIAGYSRPDFQEELWAAQRQAGDDQAAVIRERQRVCLPVQAPILKKFGFEPSRKGVHMSLRAFIPLSKYPELIEQEAMINHLMYKKRQDVLAIPPEDSSMPDLGDQGAPEEPLPHDEKQKAARTSQEGLAFSPGVVLTICGGEKSQRRKFEVQEIRVLQERLEVTLPENAVLCTQFVIDSMYPDLLQTLSLSSDAFGADGVSFESDSDDRFFVFSSDGYTWMQELFSVATPVEGGFAHRITIVHTVGMSLRKQQPLRSKMAEELRQRRLYSYKEVTDLFRMAPVAHSDSDSERTLVSRSICDLEIAPEGVFKDLRPLLAKTLEADNEKWIKYHFASHKSSQANPADASMDDSAFLHLQKELDLRPDEYRKMQTQADVKRELTLEEGIALQDALIAGYSTVEFQERLHVAYAKASIAEKDVELHQRKARNQVCIIVQAPVIARFGFEPSRAGVMHSTRAFTQSWLTDAHVAAQAKRLSWLVNPENQKTEDVEEFLSKFAKGPAPSHIVLKAQDLYRPDKELVLLAAANLIAHIRLRLQFQNADPNIIVPWRPLKVNVCAYGFFFTEEKTPLIAAVESGKQAAFDLLLKFQPMVDVNIVCVGWRIESAYKVYTALDKAMKAKHRCASYMIEKLMAKGAKSAYDLPKPTRQNPLFEWEVHFPDLDLSKTQLGDIEDAKECFRREPDLLFADIYNEKTSGETDVHESKAWCWPPLSGGQEKDVQEHISTIKDHIIRSQASTAQAQHRLLRQLFLQWHPDKHRGDQKLATKVFQWLQELREKTLC